MVGAGFRLNAAPIGCGIRNMPTWATLIEKLVDDLYPPDDKAVARQRDSALMSTKAASGMQRLAAEYEAADGRDRLEQRLIDFVPDLSFEPSPLHRSLLTLPWRDVFTTNWDTLIERAARRLPERGYQIIATPSELSRSGQPRIVKLHGTIPHVRPAIGLRQAFGDRQCRLSRRDISRGCVRRRCRSEKSRSALLGRTDASAERRRDRCDL